MNRRLALLVCVPFLLLIAWHRNRYGEQFKVTGRSKEELYLQNRQVTESARSRDVDTDHVDTDHVETYHVDTKHVEPPSMRICTADERKDAIDEYCKNNKEAMNKQHIPLRDKVFRIIVDDIHKALFCLHAKVGCTTWKSILANNTSYYPIPTDADIGIHSNLLNYNLSFLHAPKFSEQDIKYRLDNYYKVMVVRHPHDRLYSFFNQKFVHGNGMVNLTMGRKVMNDYYPDLPRDVRKAGNISFSDITRWIEDGNEDSHFAGPYHLKCNPCYVNYDYIVKLETQERDSEFVVRNKLRGRGIGTAMNVQQDNTVKINPLMTTGKRLRLFNNLTDHQKQFVHDRLQPDLDMFGYSFDEETFTAKCKYEDKDCC